MKKNELVDIIRTIVKEEVHSALPQLLMEVLAEKMTENSSSILESRKQQEQAPTRKPNFNVGLEEPVKKQAVQTPKIFTKNPLLNQVLNETVGGIPTEEQTSASSALDVIKTLPKDVLNENKEVAAVENALNRDYSKLIKAADAKAKAKRPV
jgi:hypothetical protein